MLMMLCGGAEGDVIHVKQVKVLQDVLTPSLPLQKCQFCSSTQSLLFASHSDVIHVYYKSEGFSKNPFIRTSSMIQHWEEEEQRQTFTQSDFCFYSSQTTHLSDLTGVKGRLPEQHRQSAHRVYICWMWICQVELQVVINNKTHAQRMNQKVQRDVFRCLIVPRLSKN